MLSIRKLILTFDNTDGVVLIDPDYVKDRKVFTHVLAAFRYGRDDLDVLGLTFRKDLFIAQQQVFPQTEAPTNLTNLQQRLLKKLGPNAYPFFFQVRASFNQDPIEMTSRFALSILIFALSQTDTQECARICHISACAGRRMCMGRRQILAATNTPRCKYTDLIC